jgi:hypothetical protein
MLKVTGQSLFNLLPIICWLLILSCPYAVIVYIKGTKDINSWLNILVPLAFFAVALLLCIYHDHRLEKPEEEEQFPVQLKRFTHKTSLGASLKMEDIYEVTLYLCQVEDYLERHGHKYDK